MKALRKARDRLGHHDDLEEHALAPVTSSLDNDDHFIASKDIIAGDGEEPSKARSLISKAKTIKRAIAHPHQTVKQRAQKAVRNEFVLTEQPWLADQTRANEQLREAHQALCLAKEELRQHPGQATFISKAQEAEDHVFQLEEKRQQLEVAWHMSRYVHRARVVRAGLAFPAKDDRQYYQLDSTGQAQRFLWIKWIGHLALYGFQNTAVSYIDPVNDLPYSRQELIRAIERLLVASQGFQAWWNRVRYVYRWEDPWLTTKWFILYLVLLKTGYFMTFYYSYLLYSYLTNVTGQHSRRWLFQANERNKTHDRAVMLSNLILRHGADAWFEPFLEEVGPWLQEQFLDLAQFLEISNNYYMWRNRRAGICTCFGYVCLVLVCAISNVELSIKVFWLSCGVFYFLTRPISSLYPRFRHAIDPVRWLYWNHPTQSEFCFMWLRDKAPTASVRAPSHYVNHDSDDDAISDDEPNEEFFDCSSVPVTVNLSICESDPVIMSWAAHYAKQRGRLQLTHHDLRFVKRGSTNSDVVWSRPLAELLEVQKLTLPLTDLPMGPSLTKLHKCSAALSILWLRPDHLGLLASIGEQPNDRDRSMEEVLYAMHVDSRDEAFNTIIGLSGATWQELQSDARANDNRTFIR